LVASKEQLQQFAVLHGLTPPDDDAAQWHIAQMKFRGKREGQLGVVARVETNSSGCRITAMHADLYRDPKEPQSIMQTASSVLLR
jgi:hypothetical protein